MEFPQIVFWEVGGVAIILTLLYYFMLYPIFFSPLSSVPAAHPLAKFTSAWIQWQRCRNREFDHIVAAFKAKGPYVRLGPNEIAINAKEAVQGVYGVGIRNFDKHQSYEHFITHGTRNMFSAIGKEHGHHRRRMSLIFSKSFAQSNPHVRSILATMLLDRIIPTLIRAAETQDGSIDMLPLLQSYALDFMSSFIFGLSRGHNFIQDPQAREDWLEAYIRRFPGQSMNCLLEFTRLTEILARLGVPILPKGHFEARKYFEQWSMRKVEETEACLRESQASGRPLPPGEFPLLYNAIRDGIADDAGIEKSFRPNLKQKRELASECYDPLVATRDTFGTSFSYVLYEISRHPEAQEELRRELLSINTPFYYDENDPSANQLPPSEHLQELPFLNAVIKEGLRLRNNTPGMDPRVTPTNQKSTIGPYKNLPPGIRVGTYGWCLHRLGDVFPDPLTWNPRRWLSVEGRDSERQGSWYFAFSGGSRGCVGQQVAMEMMRNAVAAIYTNFETEVADESQYPGDEGFVSPDCREKIFLRYRRLRRAQGKTSATS